MFQWGDAVVQGVTGTLEMGLPGCKSPGLEAQRAVDWARSTLPGSVDVPRTPQISAKDETGPG